MTQDNQDDSEMGGDHPRREAPVSNITILKDGDKKLSYHFNEETAEAVLHVINMIVGLSDDNGGLYEEPKEFLATLMDEEVRS